MHPQAAEQHHATNFTGGFRTLGKDNRPCFSYPPTIFANVEGRLYRTKAGASCAVSKTQNDWPNGIDVGCLQMYLNNVIKNRMLPPGHRDQGGSDSVDERHVRRHCQRTLTRHRPEFAGSIVLTWRAVNSEIKRIVYR